jgi:hypothetical protein
MAPTIELAGCCAAETALNLSQILKADLSANEPALFPSLVIKKGDKRQMTIFDEVTPKTFQDIAELLDKLSPADVHAVLVKDGRVTIDDQKSDAVIIEAHHLTDPRKSFTLAIPYEKIPGDPPLKLHRPQLVSTENFEFDPTAFSTSFGKGLESHKAGSKVWSACRRD